MTLSFETLATQFALDAVYEALAKPRLRYIECPDCRGTGYVSEYSAEVCPTCQSNGRLVVERG